MGADNRGRVVFEGAKTSAVLPTTECTIQVWAEVLLLPVCTSCYTKVPSNVFAWILVLQKKKMLLPGIFLLLFGYPGCIVSNAADSQWENNLAPSPTAQTAQTCTLAQK